MGKMETTYVSKSKALFMPIAHKLNIICVLFFQNKKKYLIFRTYIFLQINLDF